MRDYVKSRTYWLIFLTAFIAVAGVMLGIFVYELSSDSRASSGMPSMPK